MRDGEIQTSSLPYRDGRFCASGDFAMQETERSYSYLNSGFGGLPERQGIVQRFESYAHHYKNTEGVRFLLSAISYVNDQLGLDRESFLHEMVGAFLGCNYPEPPRILPNTEVIVKAYLAQEMYGDVPDMGSFSLFCNRRWNRCYDLYVSNSPRKWPAQTW